MRGFAGLLVGLVLVVELAGCGSGGSSTSPVLVPGEFQNEVAPPDPHNHRSKQEVHHKNHKQEKQSDAPPGVAPITAEEFHYFTGTDRQNWEIAYQICGVTPEQQLAKEFHTERNWAAIGHAYGQGYREPFNIAAEEGCMAGLKDSHSQWEAAIEALME